MGIEVGEYIRTKLGDIKKITKGFEFVIEIYNESDNKIVKHSKNIIDLIEEGDYVNGRKVYQVGYNFQDDFVLKMSESNYENFIRADEIKSIVTKEQIKQIEYRIKE